MAIEGYHALIRKTREEKE